MGKRKWTKEKCMESAMGYEKVTYWKNENTGAYKAALSYGWLNDIKRELFNTPTITEEYCIEDAIKYKSMIEWKNKSHRVYRYAMRNKWLDKCRVAMFELYGDEFNGGTKPRGYWTKERCLIEAKKYQNKYQWRKGSSASHGIAIRNDWYEECCVHMKQLQKQKPRGYWSKKRCLESARKHNSRREWYNTDSSAVSAARKNGWFDECVEHMSKPKQEKPSGYWYIKENCLVEARKYKTKTEWLKNSSSSYNAAKINGWYDECCAHMIKKEVNEIDFLTRISKNYKSRKDWYNNDPKNYKKAFNLGIIHKLTEHMDDYVNNITKELNTLIDVLEDKTKLGTITYLINLNKNSDKLKKFCVKLKKETKKDE